MSVLLVDDNAEVLSMLKELLALEGMEAATATSAAEALRLHRERHFPVILTDIRMPGMTGVDLIRNVKRTHPTCIVFIMTAFASLAGLVECLEAGAVDYFIKPFVDTTAIVHALREALQRHERWTAQLGGKQAASE